MVVKNICLSAVALTIPGCWLMTHEGRHAKWLILYYYKSEKCAASRCCFGRL